MFIFMCYCDSVNNKENEMDNLKVTITVEKLNEIVSELLADFIINFQSKINELATPKNDGDV